MPFQSIHLSPRNQALVNGEATKRNKESALYHDAVARLAPKKKRKLWPYAIFTLVVILVLSAIFIPRAIFSQSFKIYDGNVGAVYNKAGLFTKVVQPGTYQRSLASHTVLFAADTPAVEVNFPSPTQYLIYTGDYTEELAFTDSVHQVSLFVAMKTTITQKEALRYLNDHQKNAQKRRLSYSYSGYQSNTIEGVAIWDALRSVAIPMNRDLTVNFIGDVTEKPLFTCGTMAFTSTKMATALQQYQLKIQKIFGKDAQTSFQPESAIADSTNNESTVNC